MDFCGVKRAVCDPLKQVSKNSGFYFVGAHPMAGTERTGFRHSFPEMFKGASLIVTPFDNTPEIVMQTIGKLAYDVGFSRLQYSTPEEHDHIIAYTSQLAHVCPVHMLEVLPLQISMVFLLEVLQDMNTSRTVKRKYVV